LPSIDGITAGPDGAIWFTASKTVSNVLTSEVGRVSSDGQVTEFAIPNSTSAGGITTGPDGALWFTNAVAGSNGIGLSIGRIDTSGNFQQFPVTAPNVAPGQIIQANGALVFTVAGAVDLSSPAEVGRMTTTGSVSFFQLTSPGVSGIAADSAGNVWVESSPLIRISPTGEIASFPFPGNTIPQDMTRGPDGNVWFTTNNNFQSLAPTASIGFVTPAGQITEFALPQEFTLDPKLGISVTVRGLTAGTDGALYFLDGLPEIGSITSTGAASRIPVPNDAIPLALTAAANGLIVFSWANLVTFAKGIGLVSGGKVTLIPTPLTPLSITTGLDGNLWVLAETPTFQQLVLEVSASGANRQFALPKGVTAIGGVIAAASGGVWFPATFISNRRGPQPVSELVRVTRTGRFAQVRLSNSTIVDAMTTGPRGALYFTSHTVSNSQSSRVGTVASNGRFTQFKLPTLAASIAAGPDGNLWFTRGQPATGPGIHVGLVPAPGIGRITPRGRVTLFALPAGTSVFTSIATGSDHNLWFTNAESPQIVRMQFPVS
jgi:virginiamycin B lyase